MLVMWYYITIFKFCYENMIILLDNYDSFTWNLWHFLQEIGANVKIIKNDELTIDEIISLNPSGLVISPGPGVPENAGITVELIKEAKTLFPIFGVCLGHQAINNAFGGKLKRLNPPIHGKLSKIHHNNEGVFKSLKNKSFIVTRYHSLVADPYEFPKELIITAKTNDGIIMGLMHQSLKIYGVQFHPESVLSLYGYRILSSFLLDCGYKSLSEDKFQFLEKKLIGNI